MLVSDKTAAGTAPQLAGVASEHSSLRPAALEHDALCRPAHARAYAQAAAGGMREHASSETVEQEHDPRVRAGVRAHASVCHQQQPDAAVRDAVNKGEGQRPLAGSRCATEDRHHDSASLTDRGGTRRDCDAQGVRGGMRPY